MEFGAAYTSGRTPCREDDWHTFLIVKVCQLNIDITLRNVEVKVFAVNLAVTKATLKNPVHKPQSPMQ